jgi:hypothetical protein
MATPVNVAKEIEAAVDPKLDTLLNNFTPDQQKMLLTAYSNYSGLIQAGITDKDSLDGYVTTEYGITKEDAANYKVLKDAGITKISDVQKKINSGIDSNGAGTNELTVSGNNRYFIHTNVLCKDTNGNKQMQSILINNIADDTLWQTYNKGMMYSSTMTTSQSTGANRMRELLTSAGGDSVTKVDTCRGVAIYTDSKKTKTIKGYLSQSDYNNLDPSIINNDQTKLMNAAFEVPAPTPAGNPQKKEGFSQMSNVYDDEKPYSVLETNIVTKFYVVSIVVILLYILFRLYEKTR